MSLDTAHTIVAVTSLALLCAGAGIAWGVGYSLLLTGGILLAGVIYARTR